MFVIITPDETKANEVELLTRFVALDDVYIHIRKPKATEEELQEYLQGLPKEVLLRSSLHGYHSMAKSFGVRGVHFTKNKREQLAERLEDEIEYWHSKQKQVSTSVHALDEIRPIWDYAFLSPIFDSISKKNYKGKEYRVDDKKEKLIALGGIRKQTIKEAKALGFQGIAVLGNIWKSERPLVIFNEMYDEYRNQFS